MSSSLTAKAGDREPASRPENPSPRTSFPTVLSFDVEEHHLIEAAVGLTIEPALKAHYRERLGPSTHWLLDLLAGQGVRATFFVVGEVARHSPDLVRAIHRAG